MTSRGKPVDWDPEADDEAAENYEDCKMYLRMLGETALAVAFVAAITVFVLATNNAYKCCEPEAEVPPSVLDCAHGECQLDTSRIKNVTSRDLTAIATFSGYFKLTTGRSSAQNLTREPRPEDFLYMPLSLRSVELSPASLAADGSREQLMNLTTNCAILSFHLRQVARDERRQGAQRVAVQVESIDISPSGQWAGYVEPGVIRPTAIEVGQNESYVCPFRQEYPVRLLVQSQHKKRVVSLVFDVLAFEINGDARRLVAGLFSKPARYCFSYKEIKDEQDL